MVLIGQAEKGAVLGVFSCQRSTYLAAELIIIGICFVFIAHQIKLNKSLACDWIVNTLNEYRHVMPHEWYFPAEVMRRRI